MKSIAFIDLEVDFNTKKVLDAGAVKEQENVFHSRSLHALAAFLQTADFICGHNIFHHDFHYLGEVAAVIDANNIIDTLYLSPLLFPLRPYHKLLKDEKLQSDELNNPVADAKKARELFWDEVTAFKEYDETMKQVLYCLLHQQKAFQAFFRFVDYTCSDNDVEQLIRDKFRMFVCENADLSKMIREAPVELAYCLSLIHVQSRYSIAPRWVSKNYPAVETIMYQLRNRACLPGCIYCNGALDVHKALKRFFDYDAYRTYADEPLQEASVKAAVDGKSILAIFPTGGGKSLTFQVPALLCGETVKGLTVVISPLQSLMKDQVDNLLASGITEAVTINGLINPLEREQAIARVEDGSVSILYISPESLRLKTIERLLLGRKISRFVIDEAHCFSSWGHDFRVDYLYIADFIKMLQQKKNIAESIPVSCFTATAKPNVIADIKTYFKEKLSIEFTVFHSSVSRTNLQYHVWEKKDDDEKYLAARELILANNCPTIVYVSRTKKALDIAKRLFEDGIEARAFHGKMDTSEKVANQNDFKLGALAVIVATSAFGMGVDKKDVKLVIHYDISDSLENYVQEAGRAGRDESITANCFILFNEEDLNKHFILLNQTRLSMSEIQQVWSAVKAVTTYRLAFSNSPLEIARKAGWKEDVVDIETRVLNAIAALEDAGYVKRGQNMPRVFANGILTKTAREAIDRITLSERFNEKQKEQAARIIRSLFSSKRRNRNSEDEAEARIDYISDHMGIPKEEVINIVNLLREEKILADTKDLNAFIGKNGISETLVKTFRAIEQFLLTIFSEEKRVYHFKKLNEEAKKRDVANVTPARLKTIIYLWEISKLIKREHRGDARLQATVALTEPVSQLKAKLEKRHLLVRFIIGYLQQKVTQQEPVVKDEKATMVEFSVHELKEQYEQQAGIFNDTVIDDVEDALIYLSKIEAISIEGGFLVLYNRMTIERLENDKSRRYKKEDYKKLDQFYNSKIQQIHIVGEYAKRMLTDQETAQRFVDDYFRINYSAFLDKYFKGSRKDEIRLPVTPAKFKQLFGDLSKVQSEIVHDQAGFMLVAAGPGSGKTKVLVHKLASLLLMEEVKYEQLLMLTFSRAAATEFKKKLTALIGGASKYVDIKTFHSYCFDLLGETGRAEQFATVISDAIEKINKGEIEASQIAKTVLVVDEAQDMSAAEYRLISTLQKENPKMRVILVGDDDQNIYEFRGSSSEYMRHFGVENNIVSYELVENYRSKANITAFANAFVQTIQRRIKSQSLIANQKDNGAIRVIRYTDRQLVTPLVNDVLSSDLCGTTAVLTNSNEEALKVVALLCTNGRNAKLIQEGDCINNLGDLIEMRYFTDMLGDDTKKISSGHWEKAKKAFMQRFYNSSQLELCSKIISDFEVTNKQQMYRSDLEIFIRESAIEDFLEPGNDRIIVSTIHKAKGKEFDNVFILLNNIVLDNDEVKRKIYVGITRAKNCLTIHYNGDYFDHIKAENLVCTKDDNVYSEPVEIVIQLGLTGVYLGYFTGIQHLTDGLYSGQVLSVSDVDCFNGNGEAVVRFSKKTMAEIGNQYAHGYELKYAKIGFLVYWENKETNVEYKIVLPELHFSKTGH
ncbi:RecQ family ATP-dependent DNA helicase [Deminuibacter soli]|uniref:DNA 3'-5' helicase n=1 Tax=Deminuibacter soli TaxID=2291815 RepID=A0A3E1NGG2_9BACT|nr:RecQ family ATP-dependent DNA helicase [Deminuibacter soli]RFM27039.1 RecQ family ATP-dependent DNA helicase [Deminuibacter soli]